MKISGLKFLRLATNIPSLSCAIFMASALVNSPSVGAQGAAEPTDQEAAPDRSEKEPAATTPEGQPTAGKKKLDADKLESKAQKKYAEQRRDRRRSDRQGQSG